jgi:P27 family predicted phage terminase small subunit
VGVSREKNSFFEVSPFGGGRMAGRNTKPIEVLVAEGKSHLTKEQIEARREAEAVLKFGTDKIKCPIPMDVTGSKMWTTLVDELTQLDLMTNADVYALAIACDAFSNYVKATRAVKREGQKIRYTNTGKATNKIQNPSVAIAHKYHTIFKSYLAEFGLSPAARARLASPKDDGDDSEDDDLD